MLAQGRWLVVFVLQTPRSSSGTPQRGLGDPQAGQRGHQSSQALRVPRCPWSHQLCVRAGPVLGGLGAADVHCAQSSPPFQSSLLSCPPFPASFPTPHTAGAWVEGANKRTHTVY